MQLNAKQVASGWRDKRGHEVDFVLVPRGGPPAAIECKWSARAFDPGRLQAFRRLHPRGPNLIVCSDVSDPFEKRYGDLPVRFVGLDDLIADIGAMDGGIRPAL